MFGRFYFYWRENVRNMGFSYYQYNILIKKKSITVLGFENWSMLFNLLSLFSTEIPKSVISFQQAHYLHIALRKI